MKRFNKSDLETIHFMASQGHDREFIANVFDCMPFQIERILSAADEQEANEGRKTTQASMVLGPTPPAERFPGVPAPVDIDPRRAEELRLIEQFEKAGKVQKCAPGASLYAQDEKGNFINPAARHIFAQARRRAQNANRAKALGKYGK